MILVEIKQVGEQNIYRLYYVDYHRIREYDGRNDNNIGVINGLVNLLCYQK